MGFLKPFLYYIQIVVENKKQKPIDIYGIF